MKMCIQWTGQDRVGFEFIIITSTKHNGPRNGTTIICLHVLPDASAKQMPPSVQEGWARRNEKTS